jgi:hypothetical protein
MTSFQSRVNKLVDEFVRQLSEMARRTAMDIVTAAVVVANDAAARVLAEKQAAARPRTAPPREPPSEAPDDAPGAAARAKGEKRPPSEIAALRERVAAFVTRHPGLRVEEINQALGTTTRELVLPLRKLIADGVVRSEGEKRSTQYFPVQAPPPRIEAPAAPRLRKRS